MPVKHLYIHVPFCKQKCRYCDFYSTVYDDTIVERYLAAVEREIQFYGKLLKELETVYIGGGTPSALSDDALDRLLWIIGDNVLLTNKCEYTFEVNPGTINNTKTDILKGYGINRVSIGVQSLDDGLLSFLGRVHNEDKAVDALKLVSTTFANYSVDLIYGIPGQSGEFWEETLHTVLLHKPPHISAYELTAERETPLFKDINAGRVTMPDEESILGMHETCSSVLAGKGYHHYEISNYARPGYESRHNMNYWRRGEYIGIGPSAHSFLYGKRSRNVSSVSEYCLRLEKGIAAHEEVTEISAADALKETVFLGLRTSEGINYVDVIKETYDQTERAVDTDTFVTQLRPLINDDVMRIKDNRMYLTEKGFSLSNSLILRVMDLLGV